MIRVKFLTVIFILLAYISLAQKDNEPTDQQKARVDYKADLSRIKDKGAYVELIGHVVFYHNGVFITCDTAYRYSEQHMEGVGNVIINSDSTFIYGDKFLYNGETNIAQVFSPIIKTVDKDAILYTRNMEFNTQTNTGFYHSGGTTDQNGNIMESENGLYDATNRTLLLTGDVEMKNDNYKIMSDSISYDFNTEIVTFLTTTDIWNHEGEFLQTQEGKYNTKNEIYDFYKEAYILTEDQELWSDSLVYSSIFQSAVLRQNIQITDTTKNVIMLGDNGNYWGLSKIVLMSKDPAVINYNEQKTDTAYFRADTFLMVPMLNPIPKMLDKMRHRGEVDKQEQIVEADSIVVDQPEVEINRADNQAKTVKELLETKDREEAKENNIDHTQFELPDIANRHPSTDAREAKDISKDNHLSHEDHHDKYIIANDTTVVDSVAIVEELSEKELKKLEKKRIKEEKQRARIEKYKEKLEARELALHRGHNHNHDHDHDHDETKVDSLTVDSLKSDSLNNRNITDEIEVVVSEPDSSDYFIYGLRRVKSYNKEMQMVCDSMLINSFDSTSTFHIKPMVWNLQNQITADSMKMFTRNEQAHKVEFYNYPIMAQSIEKMKYNQIKGKFMEGFFINNEIDVLYVDGNAECIYYMGDDAGLNSMIKVTSADMEIYFENSEISDLKWFSGYNFNVYPLEKLTEKISESVGDFKWDESQRPLSPRDITTRTIRDSKRKLMEAIEQPNFKITELIEQERFDLIESGTWSDRNDPLPVDKGEFTNRQF